MTIELLPNLFKLKNMINLDSLLFQIVTNRVYALLITIFWLNY
jgi:hypothetical protein